MEKTSHGSLLSRGRIEATHQFGAVCLQPVQALAMMILGGNGTIGDGADALYERRIWSVLTCLIPLIGTRIFK